MTVKVFKEALYHEDLGTYQTHGITVTDETSTATIHDVAADEMEARQIAETILQEKPAIYHLQDAVENLIG